MSTETNPVQDTQVSFTMAEIASAIETMARSQLNTSKAIAKVIVMAAWSANAASDAGVANALLANLRKSVKKLNIINILQEHCNLAYVSSSFVYFDAKKDWSPESVKALKIAAVGWETAKKAAAEPTRVDLIEELATLVDRFMAKAAKQQLDHADQLDNVRALLGSMQAAALFDGE